MKRGRLFIVEGLDGTGKSALAKFIANKLNAFYFHATGKKKMHLGMLDYHKNIMENAMVNLDNGHDVVMDRFWPSEWAYGTILRPEVTNQHYYFSEVIQPLMGYKPIYIFCYHGCDIREAYAKHVESHKNQDHIYDLAKYMEIGAEYKMLHKDILARNGSKIFNYRIEEDGADLQKFLDKILHECEH